MSKYNLSDSITEVVIGALLCFERCDSGVSAVTVADTTSTIDAAYMRYRNDPIFHAKVTLLVSKLMDVLLDTGEEIAKLKQERDELAAQVEVMREALMEAKTWNWLDEDPPPYEVLREVDIALSITPSYALREIQARALLEGFLSSWDDAKANTTECSEGYDKKAFSHVQFWVQKQAAAKRKGE